MKDKFEDLPEEFAEAVAGMEEGEIRDLITQITLNDAALRQAKDDDLDLEAKKEAVKEASAIYREGAKMNRLKVEFCRRVLGDKGKPNGEV